MSEASGATGDRRTVTAFFESRGEAEHAKAIAFNKQHGLED